MKPLLFAWSVLQAFFAVAASTGGERAVRNPFWPQGYEGDRYPITIEPRIKSESVTVMGTNGTSVAKEPKRRLTPSEAKKLAQAEAAKERERLWTEARKTLKFGSTFGYSDSSGVQASIVINDRVYAVGELVSANCGTNRFTWRIESISPAKSVKLKRFHISPIRKNPQP